MSWQRILRFAKVRQVPVIITDETGEDPMILLSLDQLEQALDGEVGPDIPPPAPAPRPATPSFAPEELATKKEVLEDTVEIEDKAQVLSESSNRVASIEVMVPPIGTATEASFEAKIPPEQPTSVEMEGILEPEIMTLPVTIPEQPSLDAVPATTSASVSSSSPVESVVAVVEPDPAPVKVVSTSIEATKPAANPASDMSLEERFFLEY